jgi:hypothetical protein
MTGSGAIGAGGSTAAGASGSAGAAAVFFAAVFLAGFASPSAAATLGNAAYTFATTGASTVEDGVLTYSPLLFSHSMSSFEVLPTSLASADTRALATSLLWWPAVVPRKPLSVHGVTHRCWLIERSSSSSALSGTRSWSTSSRTGERSSGPSDRRARPNARRRSADTRHSGTGCRCAPRPGSRPRGSGTTRRGCPSAASSTTTRSRSDFAARRRQPTQVRTGSARSVTQGV